jgi:hypothetical protein
MSPNEFIHKMNEGPDKLEYEQLKQARLIDIEINEIYNAVPDNTLIIFTSDHGEDFNIICEKQECGHAVNYTDDILHVPLMMCYKGNEDKFNYGEIDRLSCHIDLHYQLEKWTEDVDKKKDEDENKKRICLPFEKDNRKKIMFTQGSKIGEDSIKFLKDIRVGIKDFENDVLYTQSMVDESEEISKDISHSLRDEYRLLVSEGPQHQNKQIQFAADHIGEKPPHDEF